MRLTMQVLSVFLALLISGCGLVFDTVSSGERRVPLSKYAYDQFDIATTDTGVRLVYDPDRKDVFTYVVAFDGTNNSRDCDAGFGMEPGFLDWLTSKPECTVVQRLTAEIVNVPFEGNRAPRRTHYYSGPGSFYGRLTNPLDSLWGFTSLSISQRAEEELWSEMKWLPAAIKEVRVVVIGFSRGAAIARHFVNSVHREWESRISGQVRVELWSTLLLNDTVATFQEDNLELRIPPKTEQVIHILSANESRIDFQPTVDRVVGAGATMNRLVEINLPGAHSDIGAAYRYGAGVFSEFATYLIAAQMGLIDVFSKDYQAMPIYGLVDSRGLRDKFSGTPSGYACGFRRHIANHPEMVLSGSELSNYLNRLSVRGRSYREYRAEKLAVSQETFAFKVSSSNNHWQIIPSAVADMGTRATLHGGPGQYWLNVLDGINKGEKKLRIPDEVLSVVNSYHGATVQVEVTGLRNPNSNAQANEFWFFVNGCLPADGVLVHEDGDS